ncbi:MAG: MFS transporter [Nocardioidaceae bacterium]
MTDTSQHPTTCIQAPDPSQHPSQHPNWSQDPGRERWAALVVLCIGMLMIALDATVVNVALPVIQRDLQLSQSGLAWVVNAYLVSFGGLLLLAGRLGDLISRRGVFLAGLVVFTCASLLCGFAGGEAMLVVARVLQGLGGAMTSAVILGMIVTLFPESGERAKAIGVFAFVASAGGSIGLLAGGVVTQLVSWHWIFFLNVPIGAATAVLAVRCVAPDRGPGLDDGADLIGAVLVTASLMLGVTTIVGPAAARGWVDPGTLALGLVSVSLLAGFVAREATAANPLMPLRIFRSRNVSGANIVQALTVAGMFGMFFLGVLYVQTVLGFDALHTGLAFLPTSLVMGTLSVRYSASLIDRLGARTVLVPGLVLIAAGLALFARVPVQGSYLVDVLPGTLLLGAGVGVSFPALMMLSMSGATASDAGLASGLVNTTVQVGAALGLAVLATLSGSRTEALLARGVPAPIATTAGFQRGFLVAAALVVVAVCVAMTVLRDMDAPVDSEPTADRPDDTAEGVAAAVL